MTVKRRRIRQLACRKEDQEGVAEALTSADQLGLAIFDPSISYDVPQFERKPAQATLSNLAMISGARTMTLTFQTDVKGSGAQNTEPPLGKLLEVCGFIKLRRKFIAITGLAGAGYSAGERIVGGTSAAIAIVLRDLTADGNLVYTEIEGSFSAAETITGQTSGTTGTTGAETTAGFAYLPQSKTTVKIAIGAVTAGPFFSGEIIEGGTSGAKGRVIVDGDNGDAFLYYIEESGTFQSGETITGLVSGATATSSTVPSCGLPSMSYTFWSNEDGIRKKMKGARGKVKFTFGNVGEPGRAEFEITGVPVEDPTDDPVFPDIGDLITPPKFVSAILDYDSFTPKVNTFEIEVDNTLSPRPDATDANGFTSVLLVDREIKGSFDPEMTAVADFDWHGRWFADTLAKLEAQVGTAAGNRISWLGERVQLSSISDDERDGIVLAGSEFMYTKGDVGDDELLIEFT